MISPGDALSVCSLIKNTVHVRENYDFLPISYAVKNRLKSGGTLHDIAMDCRHDNVGEISSTFEYEDREDTLKALSIVTGVFAGLYDDPTNGATRFHRHDHCPEWSETLQASALLGSYIYYRD